MEAARRTREAVHLHADLQHTQIPSGLGRSPRHKGTRPCDRVLALIDQRLAEVDAQLRALADFKQSLIALGEEAVDTE